MANIRRVQMDGAEPSVNGYHCTAFTLDANSHSVEKDGRSVHLADMEYRILTLFVRYLKYPASKRDALRDNYFPWYDVILAFTSLGVFFYYAIEQKRIIQMANRIGTTQIVLGIIGILLLVELCRREGGIAQQYDNDTVVEYLVTLHRGTLLEWRIYEGRFDIAQHGVAMAEALLRGLKV